MVGVLLCPLSDVSAFREMKGKKLTPPLPSFVSFSSFLFAPPLSPSHPHHSAWPKDASTGRMSPLPRRRATARSGRRPRLGPIGGGGGRSATPLLNTRMFGNSGAPRNIPNFPHGGNARSLPHIGLKRKDPAQAYGRVRSAGRRGGKAGKAGGKGRKGARQPHQQQSGGGAGSDGDLNGSLASTLSRSNLVTLAAMSRPPPAVVLVSATVMILLSPGETVPEDLTWASLRREIADTDRFLRRIAAFKSSGAKDIPRFKIRALQPFLCNPSFVPGPLRKISAAAAALCSWALQIVRSRPQYMEWLGAVGAAALRAKTPSSPRSRARERAQNALQPVVACVLFLARDIYVTCVLHNYNYYI